MAITGSGLPDWPRGWTGSISHTDEIAVAAAMPCENNAQPVIGVDVERIVTDTTTREIAEGVMPERSPGTSGFSFAEEITRVFSVKEALYKALFPLTRQFREFSAAGVSWHHDGPGDPVRINLTLTEDWGADWPAGTVFPVVQTIAAEHVLTIVWR